MYDHIVAEAYEDVYVTILISPKEMVIWKLWLHPIGVVGYQIDKIEDIFEEQN
jgi:hypothetical protein